MYHVHIHPGWSFSTAKELALVATREADAEVCRGSSKSVVETWRHSFQHLLLSFQAISLPPSKKRDTYIGIVIGIVIVEIGLNRWHV